VIKIDVEEAEVAVLGGGHRVLEAQPAIICEVADRNQAAVRDLLTGYGYTLYDGDRPHDKRVPTANAPPNTLAATGSRPRLIRGPGNQAASRPQDGEAARGPGHQPWLE
jgi:Methyltransferase FkbM domain